MSKFKTKNNKLINIIYFIFLILVVITILLKSSDINKIILKKFENKLDNTIIDLSNSKIVYNSLNKIVDYKDIVQYKKTDIIDISEEEIKVNNNILNESEPLVYIYNSHQTESYSLNFTTDYSISPTVLHASYILREHLKDNGISSLVESSSVKEYLNKNNLSYYYCYDASRSFIKEKSKKYNFKYIIDLHRDSVSKKNTTCKIDDKEYARIMFVTSTKHKNYEKNLSFVNELNNRLNKNYKGISRGIYKRNDVIFNQDLNDNAILIEVGGVDNTIEQVNNTLYVFAKVLSSYIIERGEN